MRTLINYFILFMIILSCIGGVRMCYDDAKAAKRDLIKNEIELIRKQLISEVDNVVISNSKMSPAVIVDLCIKHDFDITLLLAQAKVESCYGTKGRAIRTNSVFGVGAYDNGVNRCYYKNVNDSIEPYILLVKTDYLRDKTVDELLRHYVNYDNKRYASNIRYEKIVTKVRNRIINDTNIYNLQKSLTYRNKTLYGII